MKTILVDAAGCFIIEENEGFKIFQDMFNLLETYPNKKIILTGANDEGIEKYGLNKMPYKFFTLKHNPEKTDSEYYKIMLGKFNLNKEDVIYCEHDPVAVKSAQSIGINTHHYDNKKQDLESLKKFIDENLK